MLPSAKRGKVELSFSLIRLPILTLSPSCNSMPPKPRTQSEIRAMCSIRERPLLFSNTISSILPCALPEAFRVKCCNKCRVFSGEASRYNSSRGSSSSTFMNRSDSRALPSAMLPTRPTSLR